MAEQASNRSVDDMKSIELSWDGKPIGNIEIGFSHQSMDAAVSSAMTNTVVCCCFSRLHHLDGAPFSDHPPD